ncbi:uncharacterized protein LOC144560790 [Carex rostrata]
MAIAFTRLSHWILNGDAKPRKRSPKSSTKSPPSTDFPSGFRESEPIKLINFSNLQPASTRIRNRKKRSNSKEKRIDKEHDMVIVPSDGGCCLSGSESDGSDWSIGWLEPHPNDFCNSDDDSEESFAVLVPCYRTGHANPLLERTNAGFRFGVSIPTREGLSESNEIFQRWLSSLT